MEVVRTPWPEAIRAVVETLRVNSPPPMTIQEIVRRTGLNRRTVEKTTAVLRTLANQANADFVFFTKGKMTFVELKTSEQTKGFGMLDLPTDVQNLLIRTKYFPQPSKEEEILVHLFLNNALEPAKALALDGTSIVKKLVRQEHLCETGKSRFHLTQTGKMIAAGALDIYPELKSL